MTAMTAPTQGTDEEPAAAPALLEVEDLMVHGAEEQTLVSSARFSVREGEAIAIVGESGSGKSLTARSIIGLLPRGLEAHGEINYRGSNVLAMSPKDRAKLRGAEICMILQDPFTMLHPMLKCGSVITENMREASGRMMSKSARRAEAVRRLARRANRLSARRRRPAPAPGGGVGR